MPELKRPLGEQLALDGVEAVLAAESAVNRGDFRAQAEAALAQLCREDKEITADAIRERISPDVEPHHPNVIGAIIRTAARQGRLRHVRWAPSSRPSRHANFIRVWRAA